MDFELPPEAVAIAVALGCGLLIGVEREQHKADHAGRMAAGVRTCALLALTGATAALLGPVALTIAGAFVVLAVVASYWGSQPTDPGLTTEVALVLTFLIGVLAPTRPGLAAAIAVIATLLLQSKAWLHRFSRQVLSEQELDDALLLLASGLVILPLLPATPLGPFEGLELRRLWALVVVVMAINAAGYVAVRIFGARLGLPITGLASGFVSSAATHASMGHRARQNPELLRACVLGAALSNLATVFLLGLLTLSILPALFLRLAWPLGLAGAAMLAYALLLGARDFRETGVRVHLDSKMYSDPGFSAGEAPPGRPFHFRHALVFATLIALVLVSTALLERWFGAGAVTLAAAAVGFADTHAAAISLAELASSSSVPLADAAFSVVLAFSANTITKAIAALVAGGWAFALRIWAALATMLAAAWVGWLLP
jgi:uncharacterized membrane protein (DUF4010 family)